ncbi:MAG: murein biosynthesis integral membrane protein MurJ [Verrucomicrobiota bacterium]|nr:murein biosynthesis integral membrane protein MurJ [Verrucomicrobiota bacterium]
MDTTRSILRSAKIFFAGTLLSRFSGLARDMAMAYCFGSTPEVAGFMVAYRLAYVFRRLFGEGNIQAGFTPHFEQLRAASPREGALFYRDMAWSLGLMMWLIIAVLEGGLALFCHFWLGDWREIASLSMWMLPALFFLCLYSLHSALLQCQKKPFWAAAAPIAFNAAWVVSACLASGTSHAMQILAIGVTLGYGLQWLLTGVQVRKELKLSWLDRLKPRLFSADWRAMLKPMTLGMIGVGAVQINSALDAIFARLAEPSGPAYLWYAIRLQQLPLALFGIALSSALLPPLARAMRDGALERYRQLLKGALQSSLTLMLPCTFALFALARAGINLLYGRGDFSPADVQATAICLWAYAPALIPSVFVLLLAQGFFAKKSYAIPTRSSVIAMGVNIALNALLVFGLGWGAASIAVATSVSAWVNCWILSRTLTAPMPKNVSRLLVCSAVPAIAVFSLDAAWPLERHFVGQLWQFIANGTIYLGGLLGLAKILGVQEIFELVRKKSPVSEETGDF